MSGWADVEVRMSALFNHMLPAVTAPAVLVRLDTAPDRGARVIAEVREQAPILAGAGQ